jgi:hypothetical protein
VCSPQEHGAFLMHTQHLPMPLNPIDQKKKQRERVHTFIRKNKPNKQRQTTTSTGTRLIWVLILTTTTKSDHQHMDKRENLPLLPLLPRRKPPCLYSFILVFNLMN